MDPVWSGYLRDWTTDSVRAAKARVGSLFGLSSNERLAVFMSGGKVFDIFISSAILMNKGEIVFQKCL